MAMVVADVGCASMLKAYFNNVWPAGGKNLSLKLFATSVVPADTALVGTEAEKKLLAARDELSNAMAASPTFKVD